MNFDTLGFCAWILSSHLIVSFHYLLHTSIYFLGLRPSQEDRFLMIPKFFRDDCSFCGVFDGTVGEHAAEFVNQNIVKHVNKYDK